MNRRSFLSVSSAAATGVLIGGRLSDLLAQSVKGTPGATVDTATGKVRGLLQNKVHAFRGVPYGASTAGAGRFLPPAKLTPWTGARDTFELGIRAPQFYGGEPPEVAAMDLREAYGEDCLCLNVWTPSPGAGQKRPVMVWLHGGGFASGSAGYRMYDGQELARKHDVVLVGVNHRLNIFGYLYLAEIGGEKYANASNVGMLDIVAALEWVRDNIAAFGGDPGNVTIFGQSGGAGKVSTLMAMPAAKGLFHRAIAQSGSNVRGVPKSEATKTTEALLARLSLKANQLDELQKLPLEQVLGVTKGAGFGPGALRLAPVVDGRTLPADPFDPTAPELSANVPFLLGSTATEVTFFPNTSLDPIDEATLRTRVKETLRADDAQADQVIAVYRKSRAKASNLDLFLVLATDASQFRSGVDTQAERKAAQAKAPTYMYRFEWYSPVREGKLRSFHCLEIPFVFDNVDGCKEMTGSGSDRQPLADKMSHAWVAFARTGNPSHSGIPKWEPFNANQRGTLVFDKECQFVNDPHGDERRAVTAAQPATRTSSGGAVFGGAGL